MANITFGDLLEHYSIQAGITQDDLAFKLGISRGALRRYAEGVEQPASDIVAQIGSLLHLEVAEMNALLKAAAAAENKILLSASVSPSTPPDNLALFRQLQNQITVIRNVVEGLTVTVKNEGKNQPPTEEIENLKAIVTQLQSTGQELTAPVRLPTRQEMEVRLVAMNTLERLEEYRAEENNWRMWLGVFVGSILGILINVVTGGTMETETWIVVVILVLMGLLTGLWAYNAHERGNRLRDKILSGSQ